MSDRLRSFSALTLAAAAVLAVASGTVRVLPTAASGPDKARAGIPNFLGPVHRPQVRIAGWVREAGTARWLIDEWVLHIDPSSPLHGSAKVGTFAVTKAAPDEQGRLWANAWHNLPGAELIEEALPSDVRHLTTESPTDPEGYKVEFRGLIQEIQPRYWVVGNRLVFVATRTPIQGRPQIDALAEVKGTLLYGNIVLAQSIKVTLPDALAEVEFEGIIESLDEGSWRVSGVRVTISPGAIIDGTPAVAMLAEVRGVLQPDESVLAQRIRVKSPGFTPQVDMEGVVEHIEAAHWIVGGRHVLVDSNTFIDESRAPAEVGMWAWVRALYRHDGSLLALRIRLSRSG